MMKTFLQEVAEKIYSEHKSFDNTVFILPNKRAGLFLKKHIASHIGKPIFTPKIYSIEELIEEVSGLEKILDFELLLHLYESFKPHFGKSELGFETFIPWGNTLLADFNEIDRNLVSHTSLFSYLTETQRLKNWGADKKATPLLSNTIKFWGQLPKVYEAFQKKLLPSGLCYQGLQYKMAISNISRYIESCSSKDFHFVGFNALNKAEEQIFDAFYKESKCTIWWDIDTHFIDDPVHEVGLFIRQYIERWPKSKVVYNTARPFAQDKNIHITGIPKAISQVKYAGKLLDDILNQNQASEQDIALVLSDESLLEPMLGALPRSNSRINITMGLPLIKTGIFHFFDTLFQLHINLSSNGWFYKDVLRVLSNPHCKKLSSNPRANGIQLIEFIKMKNLLFLNTETIRQMVPSQSSILNQIFKEDLSSSSAFIELCQNIIKTLKRVYRDTDNFLELHFLYGFYQLFNQLKVQIDTKPYLSTLKSIYSLFRELVLNQQLDFKGEPLSGLQVMGVLETRNLDFETVILTSVNEGILPAGKNQNSFIPYDIKKEFGLPTYKEKDAIYAYHFYRLLQRAKNVHILYNTEPDILQGNEKSRFISQLLTDSTIAPFITHQIAAPEIKNEKTEPKVIRKTPALLELLRERAEHGFSPSSLTNYIKNPYGFYINNILRLNEIDEVEENIAHNTFGTIVHDTLEDLYKPLIGQTLNSNNLAPLKPKVEKVLQNNFEEHYLPKDIKNGQNLIAYHVVQKYINALIDLDISRTHSNTIVLLAIEEELKVPIVIPGHAGQILLKGKLDRMESVNGILNILDYKTGNVTISEVEITAIQECFENEKRLKAFQLLCYALMKQKETNCPELIAGIVPMKTLGGGILAFAKKEGARGPKNHRINAELLVKFETHLIQLIQEILNPDLPFIEKESTSF